MEPQDEEERNNCLWIILVLMPQAALSVRERTIQSFGGKKIR